MFKRPGKLAAACTALSGACAAAASWDANVICCWATSPCSLATYKIAIMYMTK